MDPVQQSSAQDATQNVMPEQPSIPAGATNPPVVSPPGKNKKKGFWASRPGRNVDSNDWGWISAGCDCCSAFSTLAIAGLVLLIYGANKIRRKHHMCGE